jgi:outer membrane protein insertion porin family
MGIRHLQDDEYLLRSQRIVGQENVEHDDLEELYQSKANKKIPIINFALYVWMYHWGEHHFDSTKVVKRIAKINDRYDRKLEKHAENEQKKQQIRFAREKKLARKQKVLSEGNMRMRWGEPVSVYKEDDIRKTQDQMGQYLRNRGYFDASVEYRTKTRGKRKYVTYIIEEDLPHTIDSIRLVTSDSTIRRLIGEYDHESLLAAGDRYDQRNLALERERLEKVLKNNGFFDFSRQYIVYDVFTDIKPYSLELSIVINEPAKRASHTQFTIDSVIFVTDAGTTGQILDRSFFNYNGITYQYYKKRFSKKILDQRLFLYPNELYSLDNTLNTQKQLSYLNNFKFININYDTTGGTFIANVFTSPLPKYQMTNEVGFNVTEGFPGPFYNLSLTNRNIFGGLENLQISGFFGFEGVYSATEQNEVYSSIESGGKACAYISTVRHACQCAFQAAHGYQQPEYSGALRI